MTRDVLRCLFAAALLAAACATGAPALDKDICVANDFVYCRCANGGEGTKQCNPEGDGFGECQECQGAAGGTGGVCLPGDTLLCSCRDGTQGTQPCNVEGTGYEDVCLGCPDGFSGAAGAGTGGEGAGGEPVAGGGSGGRGGGGGGTGQPGDACPGIDVAIDTAPTAPLFGTTAGAADDFSGEALCAEATGSPDVVYRVTAAQAGTLNVTVTPTEAGAGFDPMVYVRRGANCAESAQFACRDGGVAGGVEALALGVSAGEAIYLVVDGASGTAGTFRLDLALSTTAVCGDGAVAAPEKCDDGNRNPGDQCSADCTTVTIPVTQAGCGNSPAPGGGVPVHVFNAPVEVSGNTTSTGKNAALVTGSNCGGASAVQATADGNDVIFQVVPHRSGRLVATLNPSVTAFDTVLYVRGPNCNSNELVCADADIPQLSGEQLQIAVVRDAPVWVVVDGYGTNQKGAFRVAFSIEDP